MTCLEVAVTIAKINSCICLSCHWYSNQSEGTLPGRSWSCKLGWV